MYASRVFHRVLFGLACVVFHLTGLCQNTQVYIVVTNVSDCVLPWDSWGYRHMDAVGNVGGGSMNPLQPHESRPILISGTLWPAPGNPQYPWTISVWQSFTLGGGVNAGTVVYTCQIGAPGEHWKGPVKMSGFGCGVDSYSGKIDNLCITNKTGSPMTVGKVRLGPGDWTCISQEFDICDVMRRQYGSAPTNFNCWNEAIDGGNIVIQGSDYGIGPDGTLTNYAPKVGMDNPAGLGLETNYAGWTLPSIRAYSNFVSAVNNQFNQSLVRYDINTLTNAQGMFGVGTGGDAKDSTLVAGFNLLHADLQNVLGGMAGLGQSTGGTGGVTVNVTNNVSFTNHIGGITNILSVTNIGGSDSNLMALLGSATEGATNFGGWMSKATNLLAGFAGFFSSNTNAGASAIAPGVAEVYSLTNLNLVGPLASAGGGGKIVLGVGNLSVEMDPTRGEYTTLAFVRSAVRLTLYLGLFLWTWHMFGERMTRMFIVPQSRSAGSQFLGVSLAAPGAVLMGLIIIGIMAAFTAACIGTLVGIGAQVYIQSDAFMKGLGPTGLIIWSFVNLALPVGDVVGVFIAWLSIRTMIDALTLTACAMIKMCVGI